MSIDARRVRERRGKRVARVDVIGALDEQHRAIRDDVDRWCRSEMFGDEVERLGLDDLDRVEGPEPLPEVADEVDRVVDRGHRQHRRDDVLESGHQPQPGRRDDRQGALRARQHRRPVEADRLLLQAGERSDDGAVGENRLDADDLLTHRAVAHHPGTSGVRGDRPTDGRRVASGEVDRGVEPDVPRC